MDLQADTNEDGLWRRAHGQDVGSSIYVLVHGLVATKMRPTVIVDAEARLISANATATVLLEAGGGWSVTASQRLVHREAQVSSTLHARIRSLTTDAGAAMRRLAFFVSPADEERTLITMSRVEGQPTGNCASDESMALISIIDGQRHNAEQDLELLTNIFGLTPAEARLALALMDGLSLQTYSDQTGVRITTVRWHLRNALAKTGCSNQRDFVRLILYSIEA